MTARRRTGRSRCGIVLNLLLVPRYGMAGAAITTLTTITLWKLTLLIPCLRAGIQPVAVIRWAAWARRKLSAPGP